MIEPEAISVKEAARIASVSRSFLYAAMGTGALRSRRIAGRRLVLISDLRRWLGVGGDGDVS